MWNVFHTVRILTLLEIANIATVAPLRENKKKSRLPFVFVKNPIEKTKTPDLALNLVKYEVHL